MERTRRARHRRLGAQARRVRNVRQVPLRRQDLLPARLGDKDVPRRPGVVGGQVAYVSEGRLRRARARGGRLRRRRRGARVRARRGQGGRGGREARAGEGGVERVGAARGGYQREGFRARRHPASRREDRPRRSRLWRVPRVSRVRGEGRREGRGGLHGVGHASPAGFVARAHVR